MSESTSNKVKTVHMAIGLDLLGSKTSFQAGRNYAIEATAVGIKITSLSSGRIVVVPYPNVKGFEMMPEGGATMTTGNLSPQGRANQGLAEARAEMVKRGQKIEPRVELPFVSEEEQLAIAQEARKAARLKAREESAAKLAEDKAKQQ